MTSVAHDFKENQIINYYGKEAKIVSANSYSSFIIIEVDGKHLCVNKNDLFGMNDKCYKPEDWFESTINKYSEEIKDGEQKMEVLGKLYYEARKNYHTNSNLKNNVLRSEGVSSVAQLSDEGKEKFSYFSNLASKASSTMHRATSDILSTANTVISIILARHKLELASMIKPNI